MPVTLTDCHAASIATWTKSRAQSLRSIASYKASSRPNTLSFLSDTEYDMFVREMVAYNQGMVDTCDRMIAHHQAAMTALGGEDACS